LSKLQADPNYIEFTYPKLSSELTLTNQVSFSTIKRDQLIFNRKIIRFKEKEIKIEDLHVFYSEKNLLITFSSDKSNKGRIYDFKDISFDIKLSELLNNKLALVFLKEIYRYEF